MPSINYMKDDRVRECYKWWESNPVTHGHDKEKFYYFVRACLNVENVDKVLDISYLKLFLYDSFHEIYGEESFDNFQSDIVILFEHLTNFARTILPKG